MALKVSECQAKVALVPVTGHALATSTPIAVGREIRCFQRKTPPTLHARVAQASMLVLLTLAVQASLTAWRRGELQHALVVDLEPDL